MKYFNKQFHKGFTLAELMVCLALISIIATLMMPAISKLKPNKNKIMFKKAYSIAERTVSELIDDADLYPTGDEYQGFDNTTEVYSSAAAQKLGEASPTSSIPVKGLTCSGNGKFACLFANQLDLGNTNHSIAKASWEDDSMIHEAWLELDDSSSDGSTLMYLFRIIGTFNGEPTFYTSDGVAWVMPSDDFKSSLFLPIYIDVNGNQNGPNCYDSDFSLDEICTLGSFEKYEYCSPSPGQIFPDGDPRKDKLKAAARCAEPDRFKIYVRADGKMKVEGAAAKAYLGTTNLTGSKEKGSAD